jgi:4-hydroxy-3-polyprenylbenzoate decarboxylase
MKDLRQFLARLHERRELVEIDVPVDPRLEMTEIAGRLVREGGPAVLFRRPIGSSMPVALNLLGTPSRLALALGGPPAELGGRLERLLADAMPPRPAVLWRHRDLLWRGLAMRLRHVFTAPCREVVEAPDLTRLPVLTCWPGDGGPFITWPLVVTRHPERGDDNLGLYRMQVFGPDETGMHWQVGKGGGFHHHAAERLGRPLPCAVAIGADPLLMFAAMMPLPEGLSEMAFAGLLRGRPTEVVRTESGLPVPAHAEIVLLGEVPCGVRRPEGPFGDHYGHSSHAAPFPVFRVRQTWRRRDAIYVAAVVGKPPQEDRVMGNAVQEMFLPILRFTRPEVRDAWAHYETGFHALFTVSMRPRYEKESIKTALSILGEGQIALSKVCVVVPHETDCRDVRAVLRAWRERFDPRRDVHVLASTSADTLDFTGPRMNHGSKMIVDLTGPPLPRQPLPGLPDLATGRPDVLEQRLVEDALLLVRVRARAGGRALVADLVADPRLLAVPLVVVVSEDVRLDDTVEWLWGWFTRFDPASDVVFRQSRLVGCVPVHDGPMGIDATWKPGYPAALEMPPDVVQRVSSRWSTYGLGGESARS